MNEKDTRNDIQKEIDEAYKIISALQASGDTVDLIAGVRSHLRKAYKLAAEPSDAERCAKEAEEEAKKAGECCDG